MKGRAGLLLLAAVLFFATLTGVIATIRRKAAVPPAIPSKASSPLETPANPPLPVPVSTTVDSKQDVLTIEVVDDQAAPVEGARVMERHSSRERRLLGRTDSHGLLGTPRSMISFATKRRQATVWVEHDAFAPTKVHVRADETHVRVALSAAAHLDVEVVSVELAPLADAEVQVDELGPYEEMPLQPRKWKTDRQGRVRISGLKPGALVVGAIAAGFEETRRHLHAEAGSRGIRLVLNPGRRAVVTVRNANGQPVSGARVEAHIASRDPLVVQIQTLFNRAGTYRFSRQTDSEGIAVFDSLPAKAERLSIEVRAKSYSRAQKEVDLRPTSTEIDMTLEAEGRVRIEVVDPRGQSIACKLRITGPANSMIESILDKPAGSPLVVEGLKASTQFYVVVERNRGRISGQPGVTPAPSETLDVRIQVQAQWRLQVRARDRSGDPVPGLVDLSRPSPYLGYQITLGEDGTAVMDVQGGLFNVRFNPFEGNIVNKQVYVDRDMDLEIDVESGATVTGVVVDSNGTPLTNQALYWFEQEGTWLSATDGEGRFKLRRVRGPIGKLVLLMGAAAVELYKGPPPESELKLILPLVTLRGTLTRPDGEPCRALIVLVPERSDRFQIGNLDSQPLPAISTDRHGRFESRVPPGVWRVEAYGEGDSLSTSVEVTAESGIVDVPIRVAFR